MMVPHAAFKEKKKFIHSTDVYSLPSKFWDAVSQSSKDPLS